MHAKIHISGNRWSPCLPLGVDDDHRLVTLTSNTLERPQFDISLHDGVRKLAANQSLGVENLKIAEGVAELRENTTTNMRPPFEYSNGVAHPFCNDNSGIMGLEALQNQAFDPKWMKRECKFETV